MSWRYVYRLQGQLPSGKNAMGINPKTGTHYAKTRFKRWREDALRQLRIFELPPLPIKERIRSTIWYVAKDRRRRDVPGIMDALWHLMERAGIVADDKLLDAPIWIPVKPGPPPGCWILLEPAGELADPPSL